ncbi:unnamed protein product [Owenia fusiformis]|uniref:Uncharacterized protein n=1 Tax=Owenia fusiformis TaxID=6347 RepID=A0A8J1TC09_OWEFU|nr:unnamed protein product [Owenia fusiformis]
MTQRAIRRREIQKYHEGLSYSKSLPYIKLYALKRPAVFPEWINNQAVALKRPGSTPNINQGDFLDAYMNGVTPTKSDKYIIEKINSDYFNSSSPDKKYFVKKIEENGRVRGRRDTRLKRSLSELDLDTKNNNHLDLPVLKDLPKPNGVIKMESNKQRSANVVEEDDHELMFVEGKGFVKQLKHPTPNGNVKNTRELKSDTELMEDDFVTFHEHSVLNDSLNGNTGEIQKDMTQSNDNKNQQNGGLHISNTSNLNKRISQNNTNDLKPNSYQNGSVVIKDNDTVEGEDDPKIYPSVLSITTTAADSQTSQGDLRNRLMKYFGDLTKKSKMSRTKGRKPSVEIKCNVNIKPSSNGSVVINSSKTTDAINCTSPLQGNESVSLNTSTDENENLNESTASDDASVGVVSPCDVIIELPGLKRSRSSDSVLDKTQRDKPQRFSDYFKPIKIHQKFTSKPPRNLAHIAALEYQNIPLDVDNDVNNRKQKANKRLSGLFNMDRPKEEPAPVDPAIGEVRELRIESDEDINKKAKSKKNSQDAVPVQALRKLRKQKSVDDATKNSVSTPNVLDETFNKFKQHSYFQQIPKDTKKDKYSSKSVPKNLGQIFKSPKSERKDIKREKEKEKKNDKKNRGRRKTILNPIFFSSNKSPPPKPKKVRSTSADRMASYRILRDDCKDKPVSISFLSDSGITSPKARLVLLS